MDENLKVFSKKLVDAITKKIRSEYSKNFFSLGKVVGIGADGTPTTYIDDMAEKVAIRMIKKSPIAVNLLSEEAGFLDFGGKHTFVLDPIDGTRNAYRGVPFFSVSLALGNSKLNDVIYAIVKNIPTGDIFTAEKGHGSFINGKQIHVCEIPAEEMVVSLSLGKNSDKTTLCFARENTIRSYGSASLEMCMVARGGIDLYVVGKKYLRVIDIAASTLVVREAGGFVTTIKGKQLDMDFSIDERTSVIASCSKELIKKCVAVNNK
ncbi:MAG: inositol monophosphatase family protein [Thermoplasmatota archaeon]